MEVMTIQVNKQQIGKCGETLVQYRLLLNGIESSQLTTDYGIDLVAYSPRKKEAITIQVKTCSEPKPGGGKGKLALDWWLRDDSPAQIIALVDLSSERIWMFTFEEFHDMAQQHPKGRYHLYMYTDHNVVSRHSRSVLDSDFESYLLENRVDHLFY